MQMSLPKRKLIAKLFFAFLLLIPAYFVASAQGTPLTVPDEAMASILANKGDSIYIVRMAESPVVAYEGGIAGLPATKPRKGQKIDPYSSKVVKYVEYLKGKHNGALAAVGAGNNKVYDYVYTYNGFAAKLNANQAAALAAQPGILTVVKDELGHIETSSTPAFLGLTAPGGLWEQLGGSSNAGEGVIVGIVDSGIWPENPSFSDRDANGKLIFQQIPGYHGKCTPGEAFPASKCNKKLVTAQWFNAGFGGDAGVKAQFPYEFASARDADGHGSHTASTAAGNYGVPVTVDGNNLGTISGMAPRARVAAYKVCWGNNGEGGCFSSDSMAAIDQAVADGVDVINFSISGTRTNFLDPVEVAFLFAADAGVFVAASAGNSGPGAATVAHPSPWITTVGASTHDRVYTANVILGNGNTYTGASLGGGVGPDDLVYAGNAGDALCNPGALDANVVSGKIVVCDRGVIARTAKSLAVQQAGGVGMILANVGPSSVNADLHYVPTVHLDHVAGAAVRTYAQTAGATAQLTAGQQQAGAPAPFMAAFSSRGPLQATGDLLKPDLTAPGVDILAAVSPIGYNGRNYDFLSGTSMSSPHVAGLGALLTHLHPDWTPAMMKSALMTTAYDTLGSTKTPFDQGAGHVAPNKAADPGLVYDAGWIDYLGFLCGTGQLQASYCPAIGIDPSNLNMPSISIGELAGQQTVVRKVTNVGAAGTYNVSVSAPAGINVTVNPSSLTLASGASATYQVTFTTTPSANIGQTVFGNLTWSDGVHSVRSPLVVTPVRLAAPSEVAGAGTAGSLSFDITFGYNGAYSAAAHGLNPATMTQGNVVDDPGNSFAPFGPGTTLHMVTIPAGQAYARFSLFDDYTDGNDDLDLYIYYPNASFAGGSGSGTSAEQVDIANPPAGDYYVFVHGWQTDGPDANYTLFSWSFSATPGSSNMTVSAPTAATLGQTNPVTVNWTGLTAGTKYLGAVSHNNGSGVIGLTLVSVETD